MSTEIPKLNLNITILIHSVHNISIFVIYLFHFIFIFLRFDDKNYTEIAKGPMTVLGIPFWWPFAGREASGFDAGFSVPVRYDTTTTAATTVLLRGNRVRFSI
ncbi:hypothetical protein QTP88_014807 [Uroleucon formosanum]